MNSIWVPGQRLPMECVGDSFVTVIRYVLLADVREFFFLGTEDGRVLMVDLTDAHDAPSVETFRVGENVAVTCMDMIGALVVIGTSNSTIDIWDFQDQRRVLPTGCVLQHKKMGGPDACVTQVMGWAGPTCHRNDAGEQAAVYILSCAADFCVKIFRVDVCTGVYTIWGVFTSSAPHVRCFRLVLPREHIVAGVGKYLHYWDMADRAANERKRDWMSQQVYVRERSCTERVLHDWESTKRSTDGAAAATKVRVRDKQRQTMDACEFGVVTNEHNDGSELLDVDFPHLKNTCRWPSGAFGRTVPPRRMWKANHENDTAKVTCVQRVNKRGYIASGDDTGTLKVWRYDEEGDLYAPVYNVRKAHTDLIKCILPLESSGGKGLLGEEDEDEKDNNATSASSMFLSCGYDGCMHHWELWDGGSILPFEMRKQIQGAEPIVTPVHKLACYTNYPAPSDFNGIMCAECFLPGLCLFTVQRFQKEIRCYYLRPVASCGLPEGWWYDGTKSCRL